MQPRDDLCCPEDDGGFARVAAGVVGNDKSDTPYWFGGRLLLFRTAHYWSTAERKHEEYLGYVSDFFLWDLALEWKESVNTANLKWCLLVWRRKIIDILPSIIFTSSDTLLWPQFVVQRTEIGGLTFQSHKSDHLNTKLDLISTILDVNNVHSSNSGY